jgi:hypothetical protein
VHAAQMRLLVVVKAVVWYDDVLQTVAGLQDDAPGRFWYVVAEQTVHEGLLGGRLLPEHVPDRAVPAAHVAAVVHRLHWSCALEALLVWYDELLHGLRVLQPVAPACSELQRCKTERRDRGNVLMTIHVVGTHRTSSW